MQEAIGAPEVGPVASLRAELARIPLINSHSHLPSEAERLRMDVDALLFFSHAYPGADLRSAGMTDAEWKVVFDPTRPLEERWPVFAPYWRWTRLTGYSRCILKGFRDLLGFDHLTAQTVAPLSEAIRRFARPGFYPQVLRQRSNIALSVLNMEDLVEVDRELFLPLPRLNRFTMLRSADQVRAIERDYDASVHDLQQHVDLIGRVCRDWKAAGVAGVKMSQSYHRRMGFRRRQPQDAATVFDNLMRGRYAGLDTEEGALLEDYLVFACCRAAAGADLTVQFHQGMRAGNGGSMEGCSPAPLAELLRAFPEVRFDLSHSGYPYLREGAVLAKTFPNVYLNMSWIHIISPGGTRLDLREWLEMVPYSKLIAFGDDLQHVEAVYGHAEMARDHFACCLASAMAEGVLSEETALDVARAAFYDNPAAVYGVQG
ncbi:MAG: amidohydrolase family protein [Candidatus Latescibacterota bacterium]